jgi:hypothetical protein
VFHLRNYQRIIGGNANQYTLGGIYYFDNTSTNLPTEYSLVLVLGPGGQDTSQICISLATRLMYFRTCVNNVWNSWRSFNVSNI